VEERGFTTRAVRQEADPRGAEPISVPIYQSATFGFEDPDELARWIREGKDAGHVYTRWNNPTREALERVMAGVERGERAVSFGSGMAAITTALAALVEAGDHVVSTPDLYGGAFALMTAILPRWGIEATLAPSHRAEDLIEAIRPGTKVVYTETIANPKLTVTDLAVLAEACRERGVTTVVDNTFASPYLCTPLTLGIDVVCESTTKYIAGHGDSVGGVVAGGAEALHEVREISVDLGGIMSPFDAWLTMRGLQTLGIRMDRHSANARALAELLDGHEKVSHVWYPDLASHPDHDVVAKQLRHASGMITFELAGGLDAGRRFMEAVEVPIVAPSLGATRTIVTHPATVTHTQMTDEERRASGIPDGMIRLSVGIEDPADLLEDIGRALEKA
jgi:methionine-gamma-lyase